MSKAKKDAGLIVHGMAYLYNFYVEDQKKRGELAVSYLLYTETLRRFNNKLIDRILDGTTFYPGHNLGEIRIVKMKRNFAHPTIDWRATNLLRENEGISQHVYYQDETYFRWYWRKYKCTVLNRSAYRFSPTKGRDGAVKRLVRKLKGDPFAYQKFKTRAQLDEHNQ